MVWSANSSAISVVTVGRVRLSPSRRPPSMTGRTGADRLSARPPARIGYGSGPRPGVRAGAVNGAYGREAQPSPVRSMVTVRSAGVFPVRAVFIAWATSSGPTWCFFPSALTAMMPSKTPSRSVSIAFLS